MFNTIDKLTDFFTAKSTVEFSEFKTKYKEMMTGFRLIATYDNMSLIRLLNILSNVLTFRSSVMVKGPSAECFTLEFDKSLSELLPHLITVYGRSVSDWSMHDLPCSGRHYVLPLVCTKGAITVNMECSPNHYRCHDESCILNIYRCDQFSDCTFSEDELNCSEAIHHLVPCFSFNGVYSGQLIPFHGLCDGIKHCPNGTDESSCLYNHISYSFPQSDLRRHGKFVYYTQQKRLEKPSVSSMKYSHPRYIMHIYLTRLKHKQTTGGSLPNPDYLWYPFHLPCPFSGEVFLFDDFCNYRIHQHRGTVCGMGTHLQYCQQVKCPGMFKCSDSYCIDIENVCDEKADCLGFEDEMLCFNLSCPGMLRCRGQSRCVSPWKICDGYINCPVTLDDEMDCDNCPDHCKCDNYTFICEYTRRSYKNRQNISRKSVSIKEKMLSISREKLIYAIATDLKVKHNITQKECIISDILKDGFKRILKLDISGCHLTDVYDVIFKHHKHITFLNASHNRLHSTRFLTRFSGLPLFDLDISYNEFIVIHTPDLYKITYLEILKASNNKITNLNPQFLSTSNNIRMLDLRNNPLQHISPKLLIKLKYLSILNVSDREICCIFSSIVQCYVTLNNKVSVRNTNNCQSFNAKFPFIMFTYILLIVSIIVNLIAFILNITHIKIRKTHLPVTYLNINISLSGLFSILYVLAVFLVNFNIKQQHFTYSKSLMADFECICKQIFILITLEMDVFLLIVKSYSILARVKYPFKHQCRWIKLLNIICILFWICAIAISTFVIIIHYTAKSEISFLKTCIILSESKDNPFDVKLTSLVFTMIYIMTFMLYIYIIFNLNNTVHKSMAEVQDSRTNKNTDRLMTRTIICLSWIESCILCTVSITLLLPCVLIFPRNLYTHVHLLVVMNKMLLKEIIHSLYPAMVKIRRSRH